MNLSDYLAERKESVVVFAARLGCRPVSVYRYLSHNRTPRPSVLRRIAELTSGAVTANDFVEQHAEKKP